MQNRITGLKISIMGSTLIVSHDTDKKSNIPIIVFFMSFLVLFMALATKNCFVLLKVISYNGLMTQITLDKIRGKTVSKMFFFTTSNN